MDADNALIRSYVIAIIIGMCLSNIYAGSLPGMLFGVCTIYISIVLLIKIWFRVKMLKAERKDGKDE